MTATEFFTTVDGIQVGQSYSTEAEASAAKRELGELGFGNVLIEALTIDSNETTASKIAEERNALIDFDGSELPRRKAPKVGRRYPLLRR